MLSIIILLLSLLLLLLLLSNLKKIRQLGKHPTGHMVHAALSCFFFFLI